MVCDPPELPNRPDSEMCLYNGDGTSSCYDPRKNPQKYTRKLDIGDISVNPGDYKTQDEWMNSVLRACR